MKRPLVIFYVLVAYVLLQFSWWSFLLIKLNDDAYRYRIELLDYKNQDAEILALEKAALESDLQKSWQMVMGEGSVFLLLLLIGIYITRNAFKREDELNRQQRNFLLSVTHEFKSPLAAVKLNLQTIQKRSLSNDQQKDMLNKAVMETERIELLVEKSLMATSFEDRSYELEFEKINLSDLVHRVVNDHIESRDPAQKIEHYITPAINIKGDLLALTSLLENLLENAEKYSPPGSTINVRLTRNDHEALIDIKDEGIGIPKNERHKIFEKFYRIGNENTRKTKGTGLGLYIVKHVIDLHKGKITYENNHPSGSIFKMTFPLSTS